MDFPLCHFINYIRYQVVDADLDFNYSFNNTMIFTHLISAILLHYPYIPRVIKLVVYHHIAEGLRSDGNLNKQSFL